jgi:hypothetical protein
VLWFCACDPPPPPRPLTVPSTAAWARGVDAGKAGPAWVDCWRVSDELAAKWPVAAVDAGSGPADALFDCSVYDERGAIQKRARFRLDKQGATLAFRGFDGCRVLVEGGQLTPLAPCPQ